MVSEPRTCSGTYWFWGPNGGGPPGSNCSGKDKPVRAGSGTVKVPDYWTAYHEYAVEWTPHKLTYFVDQKPYKSCEGPTLRQPNRP